MNCRLRRRINVVAGALIVFAALAYLGFAGALWTAQAAEPPVPLLAKDQPVDWWFVFKFNSSKSFAGCGGTTKNEIKRTCPFDKGIRAQDYKHYSQQFVFAGGKADGVDEDKSKLKAGTGCLGQSTDDPVGATYAQIYKGRFFYVVWNDDFHGSPSFKGCKKSCGTPWGHSKGILAWDHSGQGVVMQVSTPSWPATGSDRFPRKGEASTLGCLTHNNIMFSQHFFALKLDKDDLVKVLKALENASAPTGNIPQLINPGGPQDVQDLVARLGKQSKSTEHIREELSSKVILISKPSGLHVPPWQLVSAIMEQEALPLRTATWWNDPKIFSTLKSHKIGCADLKERPGAVEIATTGHWKGIEFGLTGGAPNPNLNHAKIAVSKEGEPYAIFGDLNQQGGISEPNCAKSQNGRGGLFYVVKNPALHKSLKELIEGGTAETRAK